MKLPIHGHEMVLRHQCHAKQSCDPFKSRASVPREEGKPFRWQLFFREELHVFWMKALHTLVVGAYQSPIPAPANSVGPVRFLVPRMVCDSLPRDSCLCSFPCLFSNLAERRPVLT